MPWRNCDAVVNAELPIDLAGHGKLGQFIGFRIGCMPKGQSIGMKFDQGVPGAERAGSPFTGKPPESLTKSKGVIEPEPAEVRARSTPPILWCA